MTMLIAMAPQEIEGIVLDVVPSNRGAARLYQSVGFERYGYERAALSVDDVGNDKILLSKRLI